MPAKAVARAIEDSCIAFYLALAIEGRREPRDAGRK
jgi:hypothetical protein